jgi:hypothetical protein
MSNVRPLTEIKRVGSPEELLKDLRANSSGQSEQAGKDLISQAREFGLDMRDFLRLSIDTSKSEDFRGMTGYEAALSYLGLPVKDDFESGVSLDLASDTFQKFPGTRAMFPEVVDDMVRWNYRQDVLESTAAIVATSRTIAGTELISTVVPDSQKDYQNARAIAELANIPVYSIRTSQSAVGMAKHGMGYRLSYEFSRRARLDILTPYANRTKRELEKSKVHLAVETILNGDGVHEPAAVVKQTDFAGRGTPVAGEISYTHFLAWLVKRAEKGVPVDTVIGNWDSYLQWLFLFAVPALNGGGDAETAVQKMAKAGVGLGGKLPVANTPVNFALASNAPAKQLIGINKGETLEELIEAGSLINESERSITNQSITYVMTETSGYKLPFGDTREVFNYNA